MTETLVQWFVTHLGGKAAKELIIFIISMIPDNHGHHNAHDEIGQLRLHD